MKSDADFSTSASVFPAPSESPEVSFLDAMRTAGLDYSGPIIADGVIHRIKVDGDRNPDAWYVLHPDHPAAGAFGDYKRGIKDRWCAVRSESLTEAERAERDRRWREAQQARDADKRCQQNEAVIKAQAILDAAQPAPDDHPYLVRKGVKAYPGVMIGHWPQRQLNQCLLIPLRTADGLLATVQAIFPTKPATGRDKDFLKGGAKPGAHFVMGDLHTADTVIITEGYATAATLHEATGYPAVMAIDAGNLKPVAEILRKLHPAKRFIIAADNDRKDDGTNPGVKAATAAAKAIKAARAVPQFTESDVQTWREKHGKAPTDFNDLAALHGLDAVLAAIEAATPATAKAERTQSISPGRIGLIRVQAGEYPEAMDAAERYLISAEAGIFQRGYLCRVSREPVPTVRGITRSVGTALITALTDSFLRNLLDRLVEWEKWDGRSEDWRRCSVPPDVAKRLLENAGGWRFPVLTGVITAPTLRPDGSLLNAPGYEGFEVQWDENVR